MHGRQLNLIGSKGRFKFERLIASSFGNAGVKVNWWDPGTERDARARLWRGAPSIVMRCRDLQAIPNALDWIGGPRFLWATEDPAVDDGAECLQAAAYFDDIWLHWLHPDLVDSLQGIFNAKKRIEFASILWADLTLWQYRPDIPAAPLCEVMHYGVLTPRRSAIIGGLKRESGLVLYQVVDPDHQRLIRLARRAKILLNVHAWSVLNYECRIAEAMALGGIVVTEALPADAPAALTDPLKGLVWAVESGDIGGLAETCKTILTESDSRLTEDYRARVADYARENFDHLKLADHIGPKVWPDWAEFRAAQRERVLTGAAGG